MSYIHSFLTSTLDAYKWPASCSGRFTLVVRDHSTVLKTSGRTSRLVWTLRRTLPGIGPLDHTFHSAVTIPTELPTTQSPLCEPQTVKLSVKLHSQVVISKYGRSSELKGRTDAAAGYVGTADDSQPYVAH
jgi:hypothetical protein